MSVAKFDHVSLSKPWPLCSNDAASTVKLTYSMDLKEKELVEKNTRRWKTSLQFFWAFQTWTWIEHWTTHHNNHPSCHAIRLWWMHVLYFHFEIFNIHWIL